eukprot:m.184101 g.184101  ORF g.184101 m.184101 type:complete len:491 (+) comp16029_c0_seq1:448-1920(+)
MIMASAWKRAAAGAGGAANTAMVVLERPNTMTEWGIDFLTTLNDEDGSVKQVVAAVTPSPHVTGTLRVGDVILAVNGEAPNGHSAMMRLLDASTRVVFRVARGAGLVEVSSSSSLNGRTAAGAYAHKFRTVADLMRMVGRTNSSNKKTPMHEVNRRKVVREAKTKAAEVTLNKKRKRDTLGFSFVTDPDNRHRITKVDEDSPAGCTQMSVGDYIAKIDGVSVERMDHETVKEMLRKQLKKKVISIEIERSFDEMHVEEVVVELTRVGGCSLGLVLGSSHFDEHTVVDVKEGSPAEGKVHPDDIIEEVNGISTAGMLHNDLIRELVRLNPTKLMLHRWLKGHVGPAEPHHDPFGAAVTREVELRLNDGDSSFGFTFNTFSGDDHRIVEVDAESVADGKVHILDRIRAVNGHNVNGMSHKEVIELLKLAGNVLRLDIEEGLSHHTEVLAADADDSVAAEEAPLHIPLDGFMDTGWGKVNLCEVKPGAFVLYC